MVWCGVVWCGGGGGGVVCGVWCVVVVVIKESEVECITNVIERFMLEI